MKLSALTAALVERAGGLLTPVPEHNTAGPYQMFNTGSVELEVGELLYALVRIVRPARVLETGGYAGVSAMYLAQGLEDNQHGRLDAVEYEPQWAEAGSRLWDATGLSHRVRGHLISSLNFTPDERGYDLILLDTEPEIRFAELEKFWPSLRPGGFLLIHDLRSTLKFTTPEWTTDPYEDFRLRLGPLILSHQVQTVSFPNPRGLILFQRTAPDFAVTQLLTGQLPPLESTP